MIFSMIAIKPGEIVINFDHDEDWLLDDDKPLMAYGLGTFIMRSARHNWLNSLLQSTKLKCPILIAPNTMHTKPRSMSENGNRNEVVFLLFVDS